jgi:tRNA-2-methylthio-N6-dimethylallyladenosine synthase
MKTKKLYINTIGCQMNVYDSEQITQRLATIGYEPVSKVESADLVIVNTCTIRAKAEQKAMSFLGRVAKLKRKHPNLLVGVCGCVAQQEGRNLITRMPSINFVLGPNAITNIATAVTKLEKYGCQIVDVDMASDVSSDQSVLVPETDLGVSRFVTIMQGCDNYCTYCVVPYVRGREISRPPDEIINEIRSLVTKGVREVTLLGQNVNSYGNKQNFGNFAALLKRIDQIDNLLRIRFTTSHPKDLSDDLIRAFKSVAKLCHHIHLPVQSGSNQVLKRMNRGYNRDVYLKLIAKLRQVCPNIAITSDIIVGFPGETKQDFKDTLDLIETVEFDNLFVFAYSDRPNTPAGRFKNKVSQVQKNERLQAVLDLQSEITQRIHTRLNGTIQSVLVEGSSKKQVQKKPDKSMGQIQWTGRTSGNKIVNFSDGRSPDVKSNIQAGTIQAVSIKRAFAHSLWGCLLSDDTGQAPVKGNQSYAA